MTSVESFVCAAFIDTSDSRTMLSRVRSERSIRNSRAVVSSSAVVKFLAFYGGECPVKLLSNSLRPARDVEANAKVTSHSLRDKLSADA